MGTRCLTEIFDGDEKIVTIYRQYDGYPDVHLNEVRNHAKNKRVVNGFSLDQVGEVFNGMGCYAASLIEHLKQPHETGNIYIVAPVDKDQDYGDRWEDYLYRLYDKGSEIYVKVYELRAGHEPTLLYNGPLDKVELN